MSRSFRWQVVEQGTTKNLIDECAGRLQDRALSETGRGAGTSIILRVGLNKVRVQAGWSDGSRFSNSSGRKAMSGQRRFAVYSAFLLVVSFAGLRQDRKSTRLNSSHMSISYAVFCLKKK